MLVEIKKILGLNNNEFDTVINGQLASAKRDLIDAGVTSTMANNEAEPLIKQAIITYVQMSFDIQNRDTYAEAYAIQKDQLRKNAYYNGGGV